MGDDDQTRRLNHDVYVAYTRTTTYSVHFKSRAAMPTATNPNDSFVEGALV